MSECIAQARNELRVAIDRRAERQRSVERANRAKQHSEALVRESRVTLAQIDARSKDAAHRRAEAIKTGTIAQWSDSTHGAQSTALADLEQAIAALDVLVMEHKDAEKMLLASELAVRDAVARVITLEAEVIADELISHRERATELRYLLLGLSHVDKGGPGDFVLLPSTAKLSAALHWSEPQLPGHINPVKAGIADWAGYRDGLARNADAVFQLALPAKSYADPSRAVAG